ncbi:uncharacterized protein [Rhodnius prolixus]|uniref:uncharacterized protein n=1 Tax=Rhodnius prolixus TaxID=13249 RepID=UPI003D1897B1
MPPTLNCLSPNFPQRGAAPPGEDRTNGFTNVNGRSLSDNPAQYTYVSRTGKSVNDLIWINNSKIGEIFDFEVLSFPEFYDHLLCQLILNFGYFSTNSCTTDVVHCYRRETIKWEEINKISEFMYCLKTSKGIYLSSDSPDILADNFNTVIKVAAVCANLIALRPNTKNNQYIRNKWFNVECYILKKKTRKSYRTWRNCQTDQNLSLYLDNKKLYRNALSIAKHTYYEKLTEGISNVRDSHTFWKTIKSFCFKQCNTKQSLVTLNDWEKHLKNMNPEMNVEPLPLTCGTEAAIVHLEGDITMEELLITIKKTKNSKSPGDDGIPNEVYKHLPAEWHQYLLNLFNCILEHEQVPRMWAKALITMIYKNGDPSNAANYRPIALINNILKIFTSILAQRVLKWADITCSLPEHQAGFRPHRGCIDNIFTLHSLIENKLNKKGQYLYSVFIDLKQAFDSINHSLLWQKLTYLNFSPKLIRTLRDLYLKTSCSVLTSIGKSNEVHLTTGVLQGDSLSPILFSLFISDIEVYFRKRNLIGVSIDSINDVIMLAYADDLVLLADSPIDLQKKINVLQSYCEINGLTVNVNKTKIVIFHKSPHQKKHSQFFIYDQPIEIKKSFVYLGFTFSSTGLFKQSADAQISKSFSAFGSAKAVINKTSANSWPVSQKLLHSIILSILLYSAEVWSLPYLDKIEAVPPRFNKYTLRLPLSTPHHFIRLETQDYVLHYQVFSRTINWLIKLLLMPPDRYPRICYNRLLILDSLHPNLKTNWITQIKQLFYSINRTEIFNSQDPFLIMQYRSEIVEALVERRTQIDINRANISSYNEDFSQLYPSFNYLHFNMSFDKIRLACQLRLASAKEIKIFTKHFNCAIDCTEECHVCGCQEAETLLHVLWQCPAYQPLRDLYLKDYSSDILLMTSQNSVSSVYQYFLNVIKIRSNILNT